MALVGEGKKTADRPLRVGIINIMPRAETYEANLLRPLANAPSVVEPIWIRLGSHVYSSSDARHIARRYVTFQEATGHAVLDGLILTGAPVEELPFEAVHYWPELEAILQQARRSILEHSGSVLGRARAGQAAGYRQGASPEKAVRCLSEPELESRGRRPRRALLVRPQPTLRHPRRRSRARGDRRAGEPFQPRARNGLLDLREQRRPLPHAPRSP